jgi:hypothetical protein
VAVLTVLAGPTVVVASASPGVTLEAVGPGIPSTVYGAAGDGGMRLEKALGVGTASVALANRTDVFVVTAADGAYHRVQLPGYDAALHDAGAPGIALSPDGTKLAYAWHARRAASGGAWTAGGARVVDLVGGRVHTGPEHGPSGEDRLAWNFSWSPDGRYLAYATAADDSGFTRRDWFPPGEHGHELVDTTTYRLTGAGPGSRDTQGRPLPLVVTSGGTVLRNGNGENLVARTDGRHHRRVATFGWRSAQVTSSGEWLALGGGDIGLVLHSAVEPYVGSAALVRKPPGFREGGSMHLLGWTARDRLLALVHRKTGPSSLAADGDLVQLTLSTDIETNWAADFYRIPRARLEVVGRVTGAERGTVVSFATDLAAGEPPTREFDPPPFMSGDDQPALPEPSEPAATAAPADEEATVPLRAVLVAAALVALTATAALLRAARRRVPGT